jgi:hypothetical protein
MSDEPHDWQELTRLAGDQPFVIERVRLTGKDIAIEGVFALPTLARLSAEDQVFVAAFMRSHGSIKEMEQVFGVSYPTIKNRLARIAEGLQFVEIAPPPPAEPPMSAPARSEVLDRLARGEISAQDAITELEAQP